MTARHDEASDSVMCILADYDQGQLGHDRRGTPFPPWWGGTEFRAMAEHIVTELEDQGLLVQKDPAHGHQ